MSGEFELTWKRSVRQYQDGEPVSWVAVDNRENPPVVYSVRRDPDAQRGHQWTITAHTGQAPGREKQTRIGFDRKHIAQAAALATRCHVCGRSVPFATVEQSSGMGGWRCRDREACAAADAAKAALAAEVTREIRSTDMDDVAVTDREDGPELVLTQHGTRQVIQCTENDLAVLFRVLARRLQYRAMADIADLIGQCDQMLAAHDDEEGQP
jgi:hypothetical protein